MDHTESGTGVDNVCVANSVDDDVSFDIARRCDCGVRDSQRISARQSDQPSVRAGWWGTSGDVTSGVHECRVDSMSRQDVEHRVSRETFGDSAKVQSHTGAIELYLRFVRIDDEFLEADGFPCVTDSFGVGQLGPACGPAPEPAEGADGDVE